jgi:PAS domain S-box-containing protein
MGQDRFESSLTADGRYRLLVEAVTDYAIYMLDPDGVVTSWNPGAQRFTGYAPEEIIGKHFSTFYTEEDRSKNMPKGALERPPARARLRMRAGASVKMGRNFGRMWSSIPFARSREKLSATQRLRGI